jgi:hypothetical protein
VVAATNSELAMSAVPSDSVAMYFAIGAFWALVGAVVSRGLTLASSVLVDGSWARRASAKSA